MDALGPERADIARLRGAFASAYTLAVRRRAGR